MSQRAVITVPAREVRVGDELYNHAAFGWARVFAIQPSGDYLAVQTTAWTTYFHPEQAVAVRRDETQR